MNNKGLKIFGIITSIGMLIVLLQGALVTKTGSAEGCGATWPLCFGELIPESPAKETIIEYTHRIWSGLMGLFVIILAIWSWKKLSHLRETAFMALMAVLFIIFQGLMGAGAVIWGNSDIVLALHFGISTISFASVVLLTVLAFENDRKHVPSPAVSKGYRNYLFFVLVYCYAVIYTGAYVKHTDATYVCGGFPLCNNEWIPSVSGALGFEIGVHFAHRVFASLLVIFLIILFVWTLKQFRFHKILVWASILSLLLVLIQVIAGVSILYADTYLTPALFHALTVTILFTILGYMGMIITRKKAS
ncbi:cytochrome c oxidase assembly protein subunit 15 [Alteribacillus persepolensis]|uniref:Heme A synthase n=1 Tax=Alteribacillus persepolensis TaxID=568899 RepID=A0A1G7YAX2_9BACI|nr:heme A synthase [Alteribacillus persepolensis]SDG93638.1 cytochrome c oxidase assembly protein subunit 15 [Alteribacillus persepolensis]